MFRNLSRSEHALLTAAGVAMAAVFFAVVTGFVWQATRPDPWEPLFGPVAGQAIVGQSDNTLEVEGQKCSHATRPVWIQGDSFAQPVKPRGLPVKIGDGQTVRLPGCTSVAYRNVIPDAVTDATARSGGPVVWYFYGTETPVGECAPVDAPQPEPADIRLTTEDGAFFCWHRPHGQPWTWNTENFTLPTPVGAKGDG